MNLACQLLIGLIDQWQLDRHKSMLWLFCKWSNVKILEKGKTFRSKESLRSKFLRNLNSWATMECEINLLRSKTFSSSFDLCSFVVSCSHSNSRLTCHDIRIKKFSYFIVTQSNKSSKQWKPKPMSTFWSQLLQQSDSSTSINTFSS